MDWKEKLSNLIDTVISWTTTSGIRLIIALIIMLVTYKVINALSKKIEKKALKKNVDKTIVKTLSYIVKVALKCVIAISLVGYVGIDTSGIAALVTSLGVCAGLAVNGALSNLAGGVLLIITRPFKVDDYIEAQGYSGTVEDIHITYTRLRTTDNKVVYLPNGNLSTGNIVNYSEKETRRVDLTFSIGYENDIEKAKEVILNVCNSHELILKDTAPTARVSAHSDSSIDITVKVWTKNSDYWTVKYDLLETVKVAFDKEKIEIPYNQLDVHIRND